jgi:hypothetical protein
MILTAAMKKKLSNKGTMATLSALLSPRENFPSDVETASFCISKISRPRTATRVRDAANAAVATVVIVEVVTVDNMHYLSLFEDDFIIMETATLFK